MEDARKKIIDAIKLAVEENMSSLPPTKNVVMKQIRDPKLLAILFVSIIVVVEYLVVSGTSVLALVSSVLICGNFILNVALVSIYEVQLHDLTQTSKTLFYVV